MSDRIKVLEEKIKGMELNTLSLETKVSALEAQISEFNEKGLASKDEIINLRNQSVMIISELNSMKIALTDIKGGQKLD